MDMDSRDQVPARIAPSGQPPPWNGSEISRTVATRMSPQEAASLVKRLLGAYPSLNLHDPETYIATVTALLTGYTFAVGERAIEKVATTVKFVPAPAEVKAACEALTPKTDWADDWDKRSREQLAARAEWERDRKQRISGGRPTQPDPLPGPDGKHPAGTILSNYNEAFRIYGRPISDGERDTSQRQPPPYTGPPFMPYTDDELRRCYPRKGGTA